MRRFDIKTIGPAVAVLAIMVVPLVVWSASSDKGSQGDADLTVQWDPSKAGDPLLTVTIAERLNNRDTAENGKDVQLECLDGGGNVVAETTQPLPFEDEEQGYGPHAHQLVPGSQIDSVERCRLRGARMPLEAELQEQTGLG
jgi:hypothetical protein